MSDLTEFLLARIAEDEAVAKAATPGPWSFESDGYEHGIVAEKPHKRSVEWGTPSHWVAATSYDDQSSTTYNSDADGEYIARHDPSRVLRECEAKRRIVGACGIVDDLQDEYAVGLRDDTLRALASVYADHPDYREEWKP